MEQSSALSRPSHTSTGHGHHQRQRTYHCIANQLLGSGAACQYGLGAYGTRATGCSAKIPNDAEYFLEDIAFSQGLAQGQPALSAASRHAR